MNQISNLKEFRDQRSEWAQKQYKVGFVPTMGALHEGHLSLVQRAKAECDKVVVSIFVNPSQFAPNEDLEAYPRTVETDIKLLEPYNIDVLLLPQQKDLYPRGIPLDMSQQIGAFVNVKGLDCQMEGSVRPHFFRGVATIVSKLFNIVSPNKAFFGQKDAQQCAVIKALVSDMCYGIDIVICPTMREADGLAMSSRNRYLDVAQRKVADCLYRGLSSGKLAYESGTCPKEALQIAQDAVGSVEDSSVSLEYFSLNHPVTLEDLSTYESLKDCGGRAIFSGAVKIGKYRIIDNVLCGFSCDDWSKLTL